MILPTQWGGAPEGGGGDPTWSQLPKPRQVPIRPSATTGGSFASASPRKAGKGNYERPAGGSQATVPMSAGTETSSSSNASEVLISLWRRPPGM